MAITNEKKEFDGILKKIWQYRKLLIIEPLLTCAVLPLSLMSITNMNFNLEKACRVNLGYDAFICANLLDKNINGIDCTDIHFEKNDINRNESVFVLDTNLTESLNHTVCKAEMESQQVITFVNAIRAPLSSIFPIIVILFAGGWSDRNGLRKPCMLFPLIGEVLSLSAHVLSAIFMETIPMEFVGIIERLVPSMFGGLMLLMIGVLSYITETVEEKDRAFRFGILSVCIHFAHLIGVSFSGVMYNYLGYVKVFIVGNCFFIFAIIYLIFFIPEIQKKPEQKEKLEKDVFVYNISECTDMPPESKKSFYNLKPSPTGKTRNCFVDFFDPTTIYDSIQVFVRKRDKNGRLFLSLAIILHMLIVAPSGHEYIYLFTMRNLKWNAEMFSGYLTYTIIISMIGTFLMTGIFIKVFKLNDAIAGLIATFLSIISHILTAFSTTTALFYTATTINLFAHCKGIIINTIISSFIDKDEIGRVYSVLGISTALCGLVFPLVYAYMYSKTIEIFPGAIFLFSNVFFLPIAILFIAIYFMMRRQRKINEKKNFETKENEFEKT